MLNLFLFIIHCIRKNMLTGVPIYAKLFTNDIHCTAEYVDGCTEVQWKWMFTWDTKVEVILSRDPSENILPQVYQCPHRQDFRLPFQHAYMHSKYLGKILLLFDNVYEIFVENCRNFNRHQPYVLSAKFVFYSAIVAYINDVAQNNISQPKVNHLRVVKLKLNFFNSN